MLLYASIILATFMLFRPAAGVELTRDGWDRARWGITATELQNSYGARLRNLSQPFIYDGAYAIQALPSVVLAGQSFTALFQMDAVSGQLRQILIERRHHYATIAIFRALESQISGRHGLPCRRRDAVGEPRDHAVAVLERSWVMVDGVIHLTFVNFRNDIPTHLTLRIHGRDQAYLMAARAPSDAVGEDRCPPV